LSEGVKLLLITFKATIRPNVNIGTNQQIVIVVNGLGKDEKTARSDAQRQVRAYIAHLRYDLEVQQ
jgi:hypothetical protein